MSGARSSMSRFAVPWLAWWPSGFAASLHAFEQLFQSTMPLERAQAVHRVLLAMLLFAGTWVRFQGLGSVGLHGDEETMAMAALDILRDGIPHLPSGMLYPRGLTELYLMAGSVHLFGESEWAFRLPSALCGVALIGLAWRVGRRFLQPRWNLAFVASVAFLPDMIEYSQTARMYIFLLAAVAGCMACLFEWERSGRLGWLVGAVLALIVGIELHTLAVTCALLFLFPGLLHGDSRKLLSGAAAAGIVILGFAGIDAWVAAQYPVPPPEYAADLGPPPWDRSRAAQDFGLTFDVALWLCGIAVAFFAIHLGRVILPRSAAACVVVLLLGGLLAQLMLHYHVAAVTFAIAIVVARRYGGARIWRRLSIFAMGCALLALVHVSLLATTPGSLVKLAGAMVGQPSVWPYVRIMEFSIVAGVAAAGACVWGLARIALRHPAPDYVLLALLAVWVPLFAIGMFLWNVPSRYTAASILPLLLCAFAAAQQLTGYCLRRFTRSGEARAGQAMAAAVAGVLVINPAASARSIDSGYALHPDHQGAARFVRSLNPTAADIVLAEDVLQQTYYLGSVDYWLISRQFARRYVERVDGRIVDFYTGTPVIGSGEELERLLRQHPEQRIIVIGSGENMVDGRRNMRGLGIFEMLTSERFEAVYTGRDRLTQVWVVHATRSGDAEHASQRRARDVAEINGGSG
jgi:hypothetical protein